MKRKEDRWEERVEQYSKQGRESWTKDGMKEKLAYEERGWAERYIDSSWSVPVFI